ncbi:MAG: hypothetical protein NC900_05520 [Candidatus Omnitrophica bacterium]|nr:hypothetical protein [Candidatus Omnitrophota bacterium]
MIKKAQTILELAILILCIGAALITMNIYIKRALQGKIRDISDEISTKKYFPKSSSGYSRMSIEQKRKVEVYTEETKEPVEFEGEFFGGEYVKRKDILEKDKTYQNSNETLY